MRQLSAATAAILPGPDFERAVAGPKERRAIGIHPDPMPADAAVDRVTLTTAALASARAVMVVLSGADKRAVVERALHGAGRDAEPGRVAG